jgi:hypothetical protein
MILWQGNIERIRIKNFQKSNPVLLFFGCQDAFISAGLLQGNFHLIQGNTLRIVSYRVGFFEPELALSRAVFNMFNTIEPFQGCFADIVSRHMKYDPGISRGLLVRCNRDRCKQKDQIYPDQNKFEELIHLDVHLFFLRFGG